MTSYFDAPFNQTLILTSTTTVVSDKPSFLKGINISFPGATAHRIQIYDNASVASGTLLYDSGATPTVTGQLDIEVIAANGLVVVTAGTTPPSIQVRFKKCG
jgi:hypothetical protein